MLEAVVGTTVVLLVCLGIAIALGPVLPRRAAGLRSLFGRWADRPPPAPLDRRDLVLPGLHPTTQRAVQVATRLAALLRAQGFDRESVDLRAAVRQVAQHETEGLRALRRTELELQHVRLEDEAAFLRFRQLLKELHQHVGDRAEQLELLPF
jgi:hypothetical protein